ncbi:MAG: metal-dependent hydrolase, partial [Pseudomonadota bacterium]
KATGARVAAVFELASYFGAQGVENTLPFHKGGTIDCGGVAVTMVHAVHSSSLGEAGSPVYMGGEAGFMIGLDGETLYIMGDTDVHSDMALFQELHAPDYAIVPIGGHFTMDPHRAAFACKKFFDLKAAIPSHYQTFPMLAQSADAFVEKMAPTKVIVPTVMEPVTLA